MSKNFDDVDVIDIVQNPDQFKLKLDVAKYDADDIKVTVTGYGPHWLEVEAKHDYKYGRFSRHFHRRYLLPDRVDINRLTSRVRFGVLTVEAPGFSRNAKVTNWWSRDRYVPIIYK